MFRSPLADGLIVVVILLLFFGPKRLPMLSRSIGESIKEFKGGISESNSEKEELKAAPKTDDAPSTEATSSTEASSDSKPSA